MFSWFKKKEHIDIEELNLSVITLDEIHTHFNAIEHDTVNLPDWFRPNTHLINDIKSKIMPDRKNIFILDDVCELVDILVEELIEVLRINKKEENFNIISVCSVTVGFDMISILALTDINVDYLITDITFGGNRVINGKNMILDGVDTLIITKEKYPNCEYVIFTGNILSEVNIRNYNFSKKFKRYMGESILDHVVSKDAVLNFEHKNNILFTMLLKED